ncbi:hypothetical protein H5410_047083 [Solanum commersonii]|uniref:Uncharacterized protein n=1 Tax=Solanum commersonii TaxID=4109 RepID=A0A9J5XE17_SOLCO|nr:hypothetical protein H5410_047083 [Solanum commersonii]
MSSASLGQTIGNRFPYFKTPIYFPKVDFPSADLPNQPELTQHTPTHGRVPPASPTIVRTVPDLSNCDPTVPMMQRILGAHAAAPYETHVRLVYATGAPTFITPTVVKVPYEPDLDMPVEYKQPKFDSFDGKGDPRTHLGAYCDKLVSVGRNEKLRMKLFIQSLSGAALARRGVIKCTPTPPNVNNNPLPNHENWKVNMVTMDDKYGAPDYPNIDEADVMTSSTQPVITLQLREPLAVQTYLPRVVVTTLIARKPEYDTKAVPWDY